MSEYVLLDVLYSSLSIVDLLTFKEVSMPREYICGSSNSANNRVWIERASSSSLKAASSSSAFENPKTNEI